MKKIFLVFCLILGFYGCNEKNSNESINFEPYKVGDEIHLKSIAKADLTLVRTQNGFKIKDSDKILMIDIFGTYCVPCQKEAPFLMNYQLAHNDDFFVLGLIYFDSASDEQIIENFAKKYNAYYFITNDTQNARIVEQITRDIAYKRALEIPFKVVLKDGLYQNLSDNLGERGGAKAKYYLGEVNTEIIAQDIEEIKTN